MMSRVAPVSSRRSQRTAAAPVRTAPASPSRAVTAPARIIALTRDLVELAQLADALGDDEHVTRQQLPDHAAMRPRAARRRAGTRRSRVGRQGRKRRDGAAGERALHRGRTAPSAVRDWRRRRSRACNRSLGLSGQGEADDLLLSCSTHSSILSRMKLLTSKNRKPKSASEARLNSARKRVARRAGGPANVKPGALGDYSLRTSRSGSSMRGCGLVDLAPELADMAIDDIGRLVTSDSARLPRTAWSASRSVRHAASCIFEQAVFAGQELDHLAGSAQCVLSRSTSRSPCAQGRLDDRAGPPPDQHVQSRRELRGNSSNGLVR